MAKEKYPYQIIGKDGQEILIDIGADPNISSNQLKRLLQMITHHIIIDSKYKSMTEKLDKQKERLCSFINKFEGLRGGISPKFNLQVLVTPKKKISWEKLSLTEVLGNLFYTYFNVTLVLKIRIPNSQVDEEELKGVILESIKNKGFTDQEADISVDAEIEVKPNDGALKKLKKAHIDLSGCFDIKEEKPTISVSKPRIKKRTEAH